MTKKQNAFTLIELIVVIAILAILAVALIPLVNSFIEKSRISRFLATVAALETAGTAFEADIGTLPLDGQSAELPTLENSEIAKNVNNRTNWEGPYLNQDKHATTPWGGEYFFITGPPFAPGGEEEELIIAWQLILFTASAVPPGEEVSGAQISPASLSAIDEKMDGTVSPESGKVLLLNEFGADVILLIDKNANSIGGALPPAQD